MIVVDTNVLSDLWRVAPDPKELAWMDALVVETIFLSAITVAELRFGVAAMPQGKRRTIYRERLEREVLPAFAGRVLPFDLDASKAYGELMARARAAGLAIGNADGYIAATADARGPMVATRDTRPFPAARPAAIAPLAP